MEPAGLRRGKALPKEGSEPNEPPARRSVGTGVDCGGQLGMSMMDQQQQGSDGRSKRSPHGRAFQFNTQNVFEVRGIPARFSRNKR